MIEILEFVELGLSFWGRSL